MRGTNPVPEVVLLGADIGVYALARAAHQYLGTEPVVLAQHELGPIADSDILRFRKVDDSYDERELLATLVQIGEQPAPVKPILLANNDWHQKFIARNREVLEQLFVLTVPEVDLLEQISDKVRFAELCADLGVDTPDGTVVSFASGIPNVTDLDLTFPLIAKAADSAEWMPLEFEGKHKVYSVPSLPDLERVMGEAYEAGFRGRFILQELIPGDDTAMRSITAYVNEQGDITLMSAADVLLEEHTPSGLGNPAAMITGRNDELFAQAKRFLQGTGYRGFANFDVKVDPRTGKAKFLEVNPRIGRNNFYVTAAGANPIEHLIADRYGDQSLPPVEVDSEVLYTILPKHLLLRYLTNQEDRDRVERLWEAGRVAHPLKNPSDASWRRRLYVLLASLNQYKKFREHYPVVTESGF